ncbi:MAG: endonuclease [Candidatus Muirbacterium halophilum]|nr:endonuclease [Candidatus Muirbacterium halophilum]MCK9475198.1 endonuclease [Candidatus Muirbacterium halophilum]
MKKVLSILVSVVLLISANAININDISGNFELQKITYPESEYITIDNFFISKSDNKELSLQSEKNSNDNTILICDNNNEFLLVSGNESTYFSIIESDSFSITFENENGEIFRFVMNKYQNGFDYEEFYNSMKELKDSKLKAKLHEVVDNHTTYSYTDARKIMFGELDNNDGYAECVYTARLVKTMGIPDPGNMNCEHSWPQSKFGSVDSGTKKTDMMHIYPCDSRTNSRRGNNPFGEVFKEKWSDGGAKYGISKSGKTVFEPRDDKKGDIARGMLYFAVRYNMPIDKDQEEFFKKWNELDPVTEREFLRNSMVEDHQNNRNPFIDCPELINNITDF